MSQQANWMWCNQCQALAFAGNPSPGPCAAGGTHNHAGSGNYTLAVNDSGAPGQGNWMWCNQCQVLAFAGNPSPGACAAGGTHNHADSGNYTLVESAPSPSGWQANWMWCNQCQALAFAGNPSLGACPAGGTHNHAGSGNYQLEFAYASTQMSFGAFGTGPLSDSSTVGSGGNECQYQVRLSIQQDGLCTFWGYYENRGDVWWGTAPPQSFIVAMFVFDEAGHAYTFAYPGNVPSAPQSGSVAQWNLIQESQAIADNWNSIAAKNSVYYYWYNNYDESFWQWLGSDVSSALNWLEQNGPTILQDAEDVVGVIVEIGAALAVSVPSPSLPAGVPTGAAAGASGGGSSQGQAPATPLGIATALGSSPAVDTATLA
jgi:hypothetical protein